MDEQKVQSLISEMKKASEAIGRERDKLRQLLDEYEGLEESSDRAEQALKEAIDALSEYV